MKRYFALYFFIYSFFISPLSAKAFHLLILGETSDELIKSGVLKNIENMEHTFSYLANTCKIPLYTKKLLWTKKNLSILNQEDVFKWIQDESVASDDVIILFYSGHGVRTDLSPTLWPMIHFQNDEIKDIELPEIIEKLFLKKAALYLVLIDCCNETIDPKDVPRSGKPPHDYITFDLKKMNEKQVTASCHELFFKSYGLMIASAASPAEVGRIDTNTRAPNGLGGIFPKVFLNYFFQELKTRHPRWQDIFKKTKKECIEETKKPQYKIIYSSYPHDYQTPQYKIFLHKRRRSSRVYREYLWKHCKYDAKFISTFSANTPQQAQSDIITELDSDVIEDGDVVVR